LSCSECYEKEDVGCKLCGSSCFWNETAISVCEGKEDQLDKECPAGPPTIAIVGGTIAAVVLLFCLAALSYKVVAMLLDRREWANFHSERLNVVWQQSSSPLYKAQTMQSENPLFQTDTLIG